jgi:ABC-type glutathione transport system ATPase component
LRVGRGEVLGVVGESGSGKSTLAKLLVRLDRPTSGRLEMDGADYGKLRGKRLKSFRRAVQMVFQHPAGSLNPKLRVATSVREPLATSGVTGDEARQRIDEVLAEVGLPPEAAGRLPHEFSGGQKQRGPRSWSWTSPPRRWTSPCRHRYWICCSGSSGQRS